jgi:putative tryptophan/tyrosine transport system substrate-binding protein
MDALYVGVDPLAIVNRVRINTLALAARLPTMSSVRAYVESEALMSYGANFPDLWRRAAELVDKILRGAKPADLPVEQPTKFDLVTNLTTAKALVLTIPPELLARADEVIAAYGGVGRWRLEPPLLPLQPLAQQPHVASVGAPENV